MQTISGTIRRGFDFLTTIRADQWIEAPPELLGEGMEGFREMVTFVGAPLHIPHGNADTVMERLHEVRFKEEVSTRLVAFANVSAAPIKLSGKGQLAGYYDLYVTLSPNAESPGKTVFHSTDGEHGTFESEVSLTPLFELRPLGGGPSIFVDTATMPVPGFPMRLGSTGGTWSRRPPTRHAVRSFGGNSLFYTKEVLISAKRNDGLTLAACAKQQAEFTSNAYAGRFARTNFPCAAELTNFETRFDQR
jgi:hypothetical protein